MACICGKTDQIIGEINVFTDVSLDTELTLHCGSLPDPGSIPDSPWHRSAFSECSCFPLHFAEMALCVCVVDRDDVVYFADPDSKRS